MTLQRKTFFKGKNTLVCWRARPFWFWLLYSCSINKEHIDESAGFQPICFWHWDGPFFQKWCQINKLYMKVLWRETWPKKVEQNMEACLSKCCYPSRFRSLNSLPTTVLIIKISSAGRFYVSVSWDVPFNVHSEHRHKVRVRGRVPRP